MVWRSTQMCVLSTKQNLPGIAAAVLYVGSRNDMSDTEHNGECLGGFSFSSGRTVSLGLEISHVEVHARHAESLHRWRRRQLKVELTTLSMLMWRSLGLLQLTADRCCSWRGLGGILISCCTSACFDLGRRVYQQDCWDSWCTVVVLVQVITARKTRLIRLRYKDLEPDFFSLQEHWFCSGFL